MTEKSLPLRLAHKLFPALLNPTNIQVGNFETFLILYILLFIFINNFSALVSQICICAFP